MPNTACHPDEVVRGRRVSSAHGFAGSREAATSFSRQTTSEALETQSPTNACVPDSVLSRDMRSLPVLRSAGAPGTVARGGAGVAVRQAAGAGGVCVASYTSEAYPWGPRRSSPRLLRRALAPAPAPAAATHRGVAPARTSWAHPAAAAASIQQIVPQSFAVDRRPGTNMASEPTAPLPQQGVWCPDMASLSAMPPPLAPRGRGGAAAGAPPCLSEPSLSAMPSGAPPCLSDAAAGAREDAEEPSQVPARTMRPRARSSPEIARVLSSPPSDTPTLLPDDDAAQGDGARLLGAISSSSNPTLAACQVLRGMLQQETFSPGHRDELQFVLDVLKGHMKRASSVDPEEAFMNQIEASQALDPVTRDYLRGFSKRRPRMKKTFREILTAIDFAQHLRKLRFLRHSSSDLSIAGEAGLGPAPLDGELHGEIEKVCSWGEFDVFRMAQLSKQCPLQYVSLAVMQARDLLEIFKIPVTKLCGFLAEIERQYQDLPYHNSVHAADVVQTTHALFSTETAAQFSELEVFTTIFASICHDVGHPGVTNDFRVATCDEGAITYNDRSVNENMHCSLAYRTLRSEGCNLLESLSREQGNSVRKLMIELILATDMTYHFDNLKKFQSMVETNGASVTKWDSTATALEWLLHTADISATTKPTAAAERWTDLVLTEFFAQGDRERALGLPISPLCDRYVVSKAKSQCGFVKYIVQPSFEALAVICDVDEPLANLANYYSTNAARLAEEEAAAAAEAAKEPPKTPVAATAPAAAPPQEES